MTHREVTSCAQLLLLLELVFLFSSSHVDKWTTRVMTSDKWIISFAEACNG